MKTLRDMTIAELDNAGYAICLWTPEELGEADKDHVENRIIELGNEVIECLQ